MRKSSKSATLTMLQGGSTSLLSAWTVISVVQWHPTISQGMLKAVIRMSRSSQKVQRKNNFALNVWRGAALLQSLLMEINVEKPFRHIVLPADDQALRKKRIAVVTPAIHSSRNNFGHTNNGKLAELKKRVHSRSRLFPFFLRFNESAGEERVDGFLDLLYGGA
jgi:hypothetical protein